MVSIFQNTDVVDLCGDSIGRKTRKKRNTRKISIPQIRINMVSDQPAYESNAEIKRKHNYIKEFLEEINEVIYE
jgi:hypothetical protein